MASEKTNETSDLQQGKASSLTEAQLVPNLAVSATRKGEGGESAAARARRERRRRRARSLLVDILLFLVLGGFLAGAWFGYNALKRAYSPAYEERTILLVVEMTGVNPRLIPGEEAIQNRPDIYNSEAADARPLGQIRKIDIIDSADSDDAVAGGGAVTKDIRLTIEVKAEYRYAEGYRAGGQVLLAGDEGSYRMTGMAAKGTIVALYEAEEYESMQAAQSETGA